MDIALRCYVDNENKRPPPAKLYYNKHLVFVFDCETVPDPYLELIFGSYSVYENDSLHETALFHGNINNKQMATLKEYATTHRMGLVNLDQFIERFFHYVHDRRAVCLGQNLAFDLSRVASSFNTSKLDKTAFSLKLPRSNEDKRNHPRIYIKHINNHHSIIRFIAPRASNKKNKDHYPGVWQDTKTLVFAFTNKSLSLEKACKLFKTEYQKQKAKQHGIVDAEYIDYNRADVRATYSLYMALVKRIEEYSIPAEPHEIKSPASIGPAYYYAMGIRSFMEKCPLFDRSLLGFSTMAYFGGRVETRVRHVPILASYNDATSMYPSNFCRMRLWDFVVANDVIVEENIEFKEFLENVKLEDLTDNSIWVSKLRGLALVRVDNDVFPIRGLYGSKVVTGIGVNYAKGAELWFAYADIVASKLLTGGKIPEIIKTYKLVPKGIQPDLKSIQLFGKLINPAETDLIAYLITRRLQIKKLLKNDPENEHLKNEDLIAKIICNSCSYGKTVQVDVIDKEDLKVDVYGFKHFQAIVQKEERAGPFVMPLLRNVGYQWCSPNTCNG